MPLFVPILRLAMLFLNVYDSYKTLKFPPPSSRRNDGLPSVRAMTQRKRDMKGCLAVWIVWVRLDCLLTSDFAELKRDSAALLFMRDSERVLLACSYHSTTNSRVSFYSSSYSHELGCANCFSTGALLLTTNHRVPNQYTCTLSAPSSSHTHPPSMHPWNSYSWLGILYSPYPPSQ
jgi:hypothetical protein